ncbi:MAG: hypothetical protein CM15mP65_28940 [Crocinitomicaceae bacterium]|nr:MAG: hypothetical protein CM15mP65_28940 [Crocinitomicaceae bacterium]
MGFYWRNDSSRLYKRFKSAAKSAITAGCDMDMMSSAYILNLKSLVDKNQIKINLIDDAVKRILYLKYDLGLLRILLSIVVKTEKIKIF